MINRADRASWPEVLSRTDLAAIWGCSVPTLDRMRKGGEMPKPMTSRGRAPAWSKSDVIEWLDNPKARRGLRVVA